MTHKADVFRIQELGRQISATLGDVNPAGIHNGINEMRVIQFLHSFPGVAEYVGPEYDRFVSTQLREAQDMTNVRVPVTKCWMFPNDIGQYPPFQVVATQGDSLQDAQRLAMGARFQLVLVKGSVRAVWCAGPSIPKVFFENVVTKGLPSDLKFVGDNQDTCHITVVRSDVVASLGEDAVGEFVESYNGAKQFGVKTGHVMMTFSPDWCRFSHCLVAEIQSDDIADFIDVFNARFASNAQHPSLHATFAIVPRNLF